MYICIHTKNYMFTHIYIYICKALDACQCHATGATAAQAKRKHTADDPFDGCHET